MKEWCKENIEDEIDIEIKKFKNDVSKEGKKQIKLSQKNWLIK